ncbi:hypothetical protein FLONG3_5347 [Fusarium longipes]|uniref:Uncharacterized protein n=1 Tax=Fusarium longipes TaxID=694270 RepID=A0A395SUZ3_9HYPO|nr:hypothetical protein FLONG3_5347 [Fusarium longipes]
MVPRGEGLNHLSQSSTVSTIAVTSISSSLTGTTVAASTDASASMASATKVSSTNNNGLQAGAVAGVAIGCFFAGLLLGIGCLYFIRRSRKRSTRHRRRFRQTDIPKDIDYGRSEIIDSPEHKVRLENIILQATPDKELVSMVKRLDVIVEQHVENYYHLQPIDFSISALAEELKGCGINEGLSGFDARIIAEWCLHPASRQLALQHVISHVLFRSIDCNFHAPISLLPEPAVGFLRSIRPIDKTREDFSVMSVALSRWRTLSALLLHPNPSERTPLEVSESAVRHQAQDLAEELNAFLHHFVAPDKDSMQQQCNHMHAMIIEAAKLGYAFFSHPSDWGFIYKDVAPKRAAVHLTTQHDSNASAPQAIMAEFLPAVGAAAGGLRIAYQLITLAIESGQVKDEVRRSLELVRTCDRDLQHLVSLRDEYLDILERKPIELDRVNTIIRAAYQGLAEVCKIVEKCRPEANQGKIPFSRRSRWIFLDSSDFSTQIPVVSSHHRAVLNEISFLRQIALQAPDPVQVPGPGSAEYEKVKLSRKKSVAIDNIGVLGNLMGQNTVRTQPTRGYQDSEPAYTFGSTNTPDISCFSSPAPPPYRASNVQNPTPQGQLIPMSETSNPQLDRGWTQDASYSRQKFLSSADIQAARRPPSTLHDSFRPAPLDPSIQAQSQAAELWWENDSSGTESAYQNNLSCFSSRWDKNHQRNNSPLSSLKQQTGRSFTSPAQALPPIPPKLPPNRPPSHRQT